MMTMVKYSLVLLVATIVAPVLGSGTTNNKSSSVIATSSNTDNHGVTTLRRTSTITVPANDLVVSTNKVDENKDRELQLLNLPNLPDNSAIWEVIEAIINGELLPGMSMATSDPPSDAPSLQYSFSPSNVPSVLPSIDDTSADLPTLSESFEPSFSPTTTPFVDSDSPVVGTTEPPSIEPSVGPTAAVNPTTEPTDVQSTDDTISKCPPLTETERIQAILARLDDVVADPDLIRDNSTPQGKATTWFIEQDEYDICPDDDGCTFLQRWVLAVIYYSTGGDSWFQCAQTDGDCGTEAPFENDTNFLSSVDECTWAGISCISGCVTEIEFEDNNLAGTIPTEFGLLTDLIIWGMENGNLTGTIPTEIGILSNLIFIDLDFNQLTGTLTPELYSLTDLTQLDLNDNHFSGPIDGIGGFPFMEFLQLHRNNFTGTVPEGVGEYTNMSAFTIHETLISGTMPESVCDLLLSSNGTGLLTSLIADCATSDPNIVCNCCTDCRIPQA